MFWPDTQTGVDVEPARKTVQSAVRKYFTEGGVGVPPTVPGGDWFNQITNELLNVLAAAGIDPSKADDDQLLEAIKRVSNSTSAREALRRSYAEAGYTLVEGSFEVGGTLTSTSDVLLYEANGIAYGWGGTYPSGGYVVVPEVDPAAVVGFVDRSSALLRGSLMSPGGIGLAAPVPSISALLSLVPFNGMRVDVLSFYAGGGKGGGTFVYNALLSTASHNGVTIISKNATFSGLPADTLSFLTTPGAAGTGCWVRQLEDSYLSVAMGGAVADGVFDCSAICQHIHNIGLHVKYNSGNYKFSTRVQLHAGCVVYTDGSSLFSNDVKRCVNITNNTPDDGIFHYTIDTSLGQVACPSIIGFKLVADYPIMLNEFTAKIEDGSDGTNPYLMRGIIKDNYITARQTGIGIGISVAKMFDSAIENNEVYNFAVNIAAIGCDLNSIKRNRIVGFTLYGICERSASTFGSQNEIILNDILHGGPTSIYIKSTARHVRIYNNYCESASGSLLGFIDISPNSLPVWGTDNIDSAPHSIFVRDNRLDGWAFCTEFVYRLNSDNPSPMTVIEDSSTTGQSASVDVLSIVGASVGGLLKYAIGGSNTNFPEYHFNGAFGRFAGFSSQHLGKDIELNAMNLTKVVGADVYGNGADAYLRTNGESICVLPALTQPIFLRFPSLDGVNNSYFSDGVSYTCEIIARTSTPIGDALSAARLVGDSGDVLNNFNLTNQWKRFTFTMSGAPTSQLVGVYLTRGTNNGIIQIKSIRFLQA